MLTMKKVEIRYCVIFGKGDASEWIDWELELTDAEARLYDEAVANEEPLEDVPELEAALERVYDEIKEEEEANLIDMEDEYAMECLGEAEMDIDELNDLVADRDPHALAFFGLEDADEDELDGWDAGDLDELPLIKDFKPGFQPESPFDAGWELIVEYADPNE